MAASDLRMLKVEERSDLSEIEPTNERNRHLKMAAVFMLAIVACGAVFTAAKPSSSGVLHASTVETIGSDSKAPVSSWYVIHHSFKSEEVIDPFWARLTGLLSNKSAFEGWTEAMGEAGFNNPLFLPIHKDGPIYCLWEAKAGKTIDDMKSFINENELSPAKGFLHNEVYPILPGTVSLPSYFAEKKSGDEVEVKDSSSSWFLIYHSFKPDADKGEYWKQITDMTSDPKKFEEFTASSAEKGFHNPLYMPTSKDGPFYCLWEAKAGKTKEDMQGFIDDFAPVLNNHVMPVMAGVQPHVTPYFT